MQPVIATIDVEKRLILSQKRHDLSWISTTGTFESVVEVVGRGVVRLFELKRWAQLEGMNDEDARRAIRSIRFEPMEPGTKLTALFVTETCRKQQGPSIILETELPDLAIFALFDQGQGPLTVIRGKAGGSSGKVVVVTFDGFIELWGQCIL